MATVIAGIMTVTVVQADLPPEEKGPKQVSVKLELRESADVRQKAKTSVQRVVENVINFDESMKFNVPASYAGEFRIQLYKQKESVMGGKAVVANAGIFVKNIVAHVVNNGAIDKTFKLFSKDGSASGGSVRLLIDFERFRDAIVVPPGEKFDIDAHKVKEDVAATKLQSAWRGKKARDELRRVGSGGALRALLAVAAAAVVGGIAFVVAKGAEGGGSAVGSKSGKGKKK